MTYIEVDFDFPETRDLTPAKKREMGVLSVLYKTVTTGAECSDGNYENLDLILSQLACTVCRLSMEVDDKLEPDQRMSKEGREQVEKFGNDMFEQSISIAYSKGILKGREVKPN